MLKNGFREVLLEGSPNEGFTNSVNNLLEAVPLLPMLPAIETTDALTHVYEEVTAIDTMTRVDQDAPIGEMKYSSKLSEAVLSSYSGKIEVGEDKLKRMKKTPEQYYNKRLPEHFQVSLQALEKAVFDTNLRDFCFENGKSVNAGGTGNVYSMYFVTFHNEDMGLLYDPDGYGNGRLMDVKKIGATAEGNADPLLELSDGSTGYKCRAKFDLGFLLANPKYVSCIDNINASNIPTEAQIDLALIDCRATQGSTYIFMAPTPLTYLNKYKGTALSMNVMDMEMNRMIDMWNKTPIFTSYNLGLNTAKTFA